MRCPHCAVAFHDRWHVHYVNYGTEYLGKEARVTRCPNCTKDTVQYSNTSGSNWQTIDPVGLSREYVPKAVPSILLEDYHEACAVLPLSPKASAALSRRCLQAILSAQSYGGANLAKQVDGLLAETDSTKAMPADLRSTVDAVRNFGNFSAHPVDDKTTLQIIAVEPEEAEWCLEIIEQLFEHFYDRPADAAARKAKLDSKLAAAGKPASK